MPVKEDKYLRFSVCVKPFGGRKVRWVSSSDDIENRLIGDIRASIVNLNIIAI